MNSNTRVKVYNRALTNGSISYTSPGVLSFLNPMGGVALTPDPTQFIYIYIDDVVNPNSFQTTPSFQIQTVDDQGNTIDIQDSGLTVQMTTAGNIWVTTGYPKNLVQPVNQITNL